LYESDRKTSGWIISYIKYIWNFLMAMNDVILKLHIIHVHNYAENIDF
jgi:hypothetical protein